MSFSAFSSFLQKLTFQHSKRQLKSLPFVPAFGFSAFRLVKPAEKQEQTGPKGGTSQLVSEPYEYNTSQMAIFLKTYGEDMLRCPYKDYSSLNRWQANMNLLSVMIH
jgi:hypothetical protein